MGKSFIMTIAFLAIIARGGYCQEDVVYNIEQKIKVSIPVLYEIQKNSLYNRENTEHINTYETENGELYVESTKDKHFVFQQIGLNEYDENAFSEYSRIIIDYYKDENLPEYGEDFSVPDGYWNSIFVALDEGLSKNGIGILERVDSGVVHVNGYPAAMVRYVRKGRDGAPAVCCVAYDIFNKVEECSIVFSYRKTEQEKWLDTERKIKESFCFIHKHISDDTPQLISTDTDHVSDYSPSAVFWLISIVLVFAFFILKKKR